MHELSCRVMRYTRHHLLHKLGKHVLAQLAKDLAAKSAIQNRDRGCNVSMSRKRYVILARHVKTHRTSPAHGAA